MPERTVQHRLGVLYGTGLVNRHRPQAAIGTCPYHVWLTPFGAAATIRQRADAAQRELLTRRLAKAEAQRHKLLDASRGAADPALPRVGAPQGSRLVGGGSASFTVGVAGPAPS